VKDTLPPHVIDARGPTRWDAEGKKLRKRALGWKATPYRYTPDQDAHRYAEALGVDAKEARERAAAQRAISQEVIATTRTVIDATGPTDWARDAKSKALRQRINTAVHKRLYASSAHLRNRYAKDPQAAFG
jgi:hypothetical protein